MIFVFECPVMVRQPAQSPFDTVRLQPLVNCSIELCRSLPQLVEDMEALDGPVIVDSVAVDTGKMVEQPVSSFLAEVEEVDAQA